jgi:PqqD family protein of HPr-rel-A system
LEENSPEIGILWRIVDLSQLDWRSWDGEIAVYDDRSGDTHRLVGMAAELFEHLGRASATEQGLAVAIARDHELVLDSDLRRGIAEALDGLARLGLVRKAPA